MNTFHFIIQNTQNGEQRMFERPPFPPDVNRQLSEFCVCAIALSECSFVKNWPQVRISIHLANDGLITDAGNLPSDEEVAAFLHRLRPIYLSKEQTNFDRVTNLISHHLNDSAITEYMRQLKRNYDGRASQEVFKISASGKLLNSEEFFDHYVNALEYHRDHSRRQCIDSIAEHFPLEALKPIFTLLLGFRMNAINRIASFLLTCLDREDGRPITIQVA